MTDHTLYLAGPVAALEDGGASWRDALVDAYADADVAFSNPLDHLNAPAEDVDIVPHESDDPSEVTPDEIVENDKEMLRESDGVLVGYSREHQIGTPMEVMWAFEHGIPAVVWIRDETLYSELSPWYRYHADAVTTSRSGAVEKLRLAVDELASPEDVFAED
jgi:nucleoside 2-deoxyribosyltransferase